MSVGEGRTRPARISVIVPVLNEERRIGARLEELSRTDGFQEILLVDGGSSDRTLEIARRYPGVRVLSAPRGRAVQMNAGARLATGDVLLFLHADVLLPQDAAQWVSTALSHPGTVAGAFRTWTVADAERSWLGPLLHLADLRSRYSRLPYGDQGLFVQRDAFSKVGGFPEQPLMEDLALSRRLRSMGRIRIVAANVRVSGRRFLTRPLWYGFLINVFPLLYRLGVSPRRLAALYGNPR